MNTKFRMPADGEAELSVLAELADPLHHNLLWVTEETFYDVRHRRLFRHIKGETLRVPLSEGDLAYLDHIVKYACPLTAEILASFVDCYSRRLRLVELEVERMDLFDGYDTDE